MQHLVTTNKPNEVRVGVHILTINPDYMLGRHELEPLFPERPPRSGQATVQFENGYGASVITGPGAYCSYDHPYELAILHGPDQNLCYSTPITDDVMGYLDLPQLEATLDAIAALPRHDDCTHGHVHTEDN